MPFVSGNEHLCYPFNSIALLRLKNPNQFAENSSGAELSHMDRLFCGGAAGITSVTFTYPLDIVRTRLSIQSASFAALSQKGAEERLPGMFQTMVLMYRKEGGVVALYRGILPTVAGVAPYVSVAFIHDTSALANQVEGRAEFHDIRISAQIFDAGGGEESQLIS